jgi:RimJ/RimL family protein N-acetyltransferase
MNQRQNHLGQPIGDPMEDWQPVSRPSRTIMEGQYCRLEPMDIDRHISDLFAAFKLDKEDRNWTYLPYGPFESEADLRVWMTKTCLNDDPLFHTVIDKTTGKAVGVATYLRIDPPVGVIEVGHINFSPLLQRTAAATETMFLMMKRAFSELGYRRYEWKCDNLNGPSKRAAERLGFTFEGVFRQATMYKGRNRDTAWFSITDVEWPAIERTISAWLDASNFDENGAPLTSLHDTMKQR